MNRRSFLGTLGVFSILPGAGRVWRAVRQPTISLPELFDLVYDYKLHRQNTLYDYILTRIQAEKLIRSIEVQPRLPMHHEAAEEKETPVQDVDHQLQHTAQSVVQELPVLVFPSGHSGLRILPPKPAAVPWAQHGLA